MDRDGTDKGTVPHEDADRLLALQELRDLGRIHDDTYDVEAARLVGARHTDDAPHKSAEVPQTRQRLGGDSRSSDAS